MVITQFNLYTDICFYEYAHNSGPNCDDFGTCYVLADIAKYLANLYVT